MNEAKAELISCVHRKVGQYVNFKHTPMLLPLHNDPDFKQLAAENLQGFNAHYNAQNKETKAPDLLSKNEAIPFIKSLNELMDNKYVYTNSDLSLRSTAKMINLSPNKLSFILNEFIGKNFNEFVNGYRLKTFQEKALDPKNSHLTLLALAYESGFSSKSVFNDYFKKATGLTPKAWIKQQRVRKS